MAGTAREQLDDLVCDIVADYDSEYDSYGATSERIVNALLANPDVVLRALGGEEMPAGQFYRDDPWWVFPIVYKINLG